MGRDLARPTSILRRAWLLAFQSLNGGGNHTNRQSSVEAAPIPYMEDRRLNQLHGVNAEQRHGMGTVVGPSLRKPRFSSAAHWVAPLTADRGDGDLDVQIKERRSSRFLTGINMMSAFPPEVETCIASAIGPGRIHAA